MISGQYSRVARLFENISAESSLEKNTIITAYTPSHALVLKYTKARHAVH